MKQGRPRKEGPRKPSGQLKARPNQSGATDELQDRIRFYTAGSKRGDAESPMGVLVARSLVDEAIREKITTPYMIAMKKCFGSYGPAVPGDGTERGFDSSHDDHAEQQARQHIKRCDRVLNVSVATATSGSWSGACDLLPGWIGTIGEIACVELG